MAALGREIGRWIYGGYEMRDKAHEHSGDAQKLLLKYKVGRLDSSFTRDLFEGIEEGKTLRDYSFSLKEQNGVTDLHMHIKLHNPAIKFLPRINDIAQFGKYFAITSPDVHRTRNYACVFTTTETLLPEYVKLVNSVDNKADYVSPWKELSDLKSDFIPLIVKAKGKMSTYLADEAKEEAKLVVGGPYVYLKCHFE